MVSAQRGVLLQISVAVRKKCGKVRDRCGRSAEEARRECGTAAEEVRKKCGAAAEEVRRRKCGTTAEAAQKKEEDEKRQ